jgi:hypothetical protein
MGFDRKAFMATQFVPKEAEVEIKDTELVNFFDGEKFWKVRGLTGPQVGKANETAENIGPLKSIIEGIASGRGKETTKSIKEMLGATDDVPADIAKRLEHLCIGSVEPEVNMELAVRMCDKFPVEFYNLTNKILELTGHGHVPGKAKPSGTMKKSSSA